MADVPYELKNNSIDTIPVMGSDAANDLVPLPAGTTPTVNNPNPAELQAVISGNNLVINALVWPMAQNGVRLEIDDGSLTPFFLVVTVVDDLSPVSVGLDLAHVTHATQPVPPAVVATP